MRRVRSLPALFLACAMVVTACGDDDTASTTATTPATTTTFAITTPTTTTQPVTTTAVRPDGFTAADLEAAVLHDGDPWAVVVTGVAGFELTLDDVWPADQYPAERAIYEGAGFEAGYFAAFVENDGLLLTGAHLFSDFAGAETAFFLIEESFSNVDLVALITNLAPGSLTTVMPLDVPALGELATGVLVTGPEAQVVGVIWVTGNLLQFVRAGMTLGDGDRSAGALAVAMALAGRMADG